MDGLHHKGSLNNWKLQKPSEELSKIIDHTQNRMNCL